ncbi:hypothetical protein [Mammaliicoccus sciuri]|uniref:hypothetical protein n=1 Tax=Mammaliicoccus sciuri TaxID=1296 RepID=UPI00177DD210|nr:hypothetical protein [Mammaliicoccus sciuri]
MNNYIFQHYHSKENVITANFLFFISNIRRISERAYMNFIWNIQESQIPSENNFITPIIKNQFRSRKKESIPDGMIHQPSNKIVIETKGNGALFREKQIKGHLEYFENEDLKIILTLDKYDLKIVDKEMVKKCVDSKNIELKEKNLAPIIHVHLRFKDIIEKIKDVVDETREFDLVDLIEAYESYLETDNLIDDIEGRMRMCLSSESFNYNIDNSLYFHPAEKRGYNYKPIEYIGLYKQKAIRAIGKVKVVLLSEIKNNDIQLINVSDNYSISEEEILQIQNRIQKIANEKWSNLLDEPHYYYIVESFEITEYKKITKGAPMGVKYFNINDILETDSLSIEDIAEKLKHYEWG